MGGTAGLNDGGGFAQVIGQMGSFFLNVSVIQVDQNHAGLDDFCGFGLSVLPDDAGDDEESNTFP